MQARRIRLHLRALSACVRCLFTARQQMCDLVMDYKRLHQLVCRAMHRRQHRQHCISPTTASWWLRSLIAGVVAFHLGFVQFHLATTVHLHGALATAVEQVHHHHDHHHGHHDSDEHVPHPDSDHTLTLATQRQAQSVVAFTAFALPANSVTALPPPTLLSLPLTFELVRPSAESPPDPAPPRAPPVV